MPRDRIRIAQTFGRVLPTRMRLPPRVFRCPNAEERPLGRSRAVLEDSTPELGPSGACAHNGELVSSRVSSNHLLRLLDTEALGSLSPVTVQLRAREVLYEPGLPALYVYFPMNAVISIVSKMESGASAEVAVVGREGMVGLESILGTVQSPTAAVVQVAGTAARASTSQLRIERLQRPSIRTIFDRYTEARLIQIAQTAACNRLHSVEARLARWLLAIADRIDDDSLTLPQEFIAQMLGVHRPTVSLTLQGLRDAGVIAYRGRSLMIRDRPGLERRACECHGVLHREFDRLFRSPIEGFETLPETIQKTAKRKDQSAAALETMREIAGRLLLATIREQEARDEAETANRAKDQFLAMVSHELRTPLNAILGWCAILAERRDETPERGLTVIQRNAQALLKLVEELLDAARVTADTLSIHASPMNLTEVIGSAVDTVKPAAANKGVVLRATISDAPTPMIGDSDRLRQVFLNVLSNALKFTDAGGSIEVCAGSAGHTARVSIRDTGSGIAPDLLGHVFERFLQGADSTTGRQGLGLGLSIARVLVELHGGTIQIASLGEGQGTTCTIELPLTASVAATESLASAAGGEF
jgi:signal transduction histidine kinase